VVKKDDDLKKAAALRADQRKERALLFGRPLLQ
jgi:hypothetical protein